MPFSEGFHGSLMILDDKDCVWFFPALTHIKVRKEILQRFSFGEAAARKCRRRKLMFPAKLKFAGEDSWIF